jgi:K(+)-stimulated pyrophosphate-energized sodium pump
MEDDNDSEHRALLGWILGIAVTLSITIALLSGAVATIGSQPAKATAASAAPAPATAPAAPFVAKLYFDSGAASLDAEASAALAPVLDAARARADARLAISGFHDRSGNPEQNAELSKQRAFAVRDALVAGGVVESRIELRKPAETEGAGENREARRVEVSLE